MEWYSSIALSQSLPTRFLPRALSVTGVAGPGKRPKRGKKKSHNFDAPCATLIVL